MNNVTLNLWLTLAGLAFLVVLVFGLSRRSLRRRRAMESLPERTDLSARSEQESLPSSSEPGHPEPDAAQPPQRRPGAVNLERFR